MRGGVFIGLGANLPSPTHGRPRETVVAAMAALEAAGLVIRARSPLYESEPVPASDQPWYVNAVIEVETGSDCVELLRLLHSVENAFGRVRSVPNAPRILDLDLLDCRGLVRAGPDAPILPHPRLADRAFVLLPLVDIASGWRHPVSGRTARELAAALPPGQRIRRAD